MERAFGAFVRGTGTLTHVSVFSFPPSDANDVWFPEAEGPIHTRLAQRTRKWNGQHKSMEKGFVPDYAGQAQGAGGTAGASDTAK